MNDEQVLNKRAVYKKWVKELSRSNVAVFYPGFVPYVGGVKAALLLSQLLYWNGVQASKAGKNARQREGWIYKSVGDLQRETGLSKCEQQTARRTLVALGVIEARLRGVPRVWYYRVNLQRLTLLMGDDPAAGNLPAAGFLPEATPLDEQPDQSGEQTDPSLGGISAQFNKESKNTPENTIEFAVRSEPSDPRKNHPAVVLFKTVTGMYPAKAVMDLVIQEFGDTPDAERFAEVYEAWCARGYRPTNLVGQLDWYRKGIPPVSLPVRGGRPGALAKPVRRLEEGPRSEADLADLRAKLRAARHAAKSRI